MSDGSQGIRIDNPVNVVFVDRVDPAFMVSRLKEEGDSHFTALDYKVSRLPRRPL